MALTCMRMRDRLFEVLSGRAEEAERLELELHLQECARCRRDHAALEGLRQLRAWEPPSLSPGSREVVRRAALQAATAPVAARPAVRRAAWPIVGLSLACAGAVALLLGVGRSPAPARILGGDVVVAATADGARLHSDGGGRALVGGARLELQPGSAAAWQRSGRTLVLERGRVTVDASAAQPLTVVTRHFRVEVAAAVLVVEEDEVVISSGLVHVRAPDGAALADVAAGQRWQWHDATPASPREELPAPASPSREEPSPPREVVVAAAPARHHATTPAHAASHHAHPAGAREIAAAAAPPSRTPAASAAPSSAPPPVTSAPAPPVATAAPAQPSPAPAPAPTPGERLERARKILARGDAAGARALLSPLPTGELAPEAQLLTAESYLIEGRYQLAVDNYRVVLRRFAGSPQAEGALYAIAQLQCERGSKSDAVRSLRQYLDRYPQGRFAAEARDRLDKLTRP